jgi:hypothetical protein
MPKMRLGQVRQIDVSGGPQCNEKNFLHTWLINLDFVEIEKTNIQGVTCPCKKHFVLFAE